MTIKAKNILTLSSAENGFMFHAPTIEADTALFKSDTEQGSTINKTKEKFKSYAAAITEACKEQQHQNKL